MVWKNQVSLNGIRVLKVVSENEKFIEVDSQKQKWLTHRLKNLIWFDRCLILQLMAHEL